MKEALPGWPLAEFQAAFGAALESALRASRLAPQILAAQKLD